MANIKKIKELLHYCDCHEVTVVDSECGKYFKELFDGDKFDRHPCFDECFPRIGLYLPSVATNPTMFIEFTVDYDREDGEDTELLLFNDDDAEYNNGHWGDRYIDDKMYHGDLEYSDIEDRIWNKIEQIIYEKAKKHVIEHKNTAEKNAKLWGDECDYFFDKFKDYKE